MTARDLEGKGKGLSINQTFGDLFVALPWGVGKEQTPECDLDVWMVLLDPVEDGGGFFEG